MTWSPWRQLSRGLRRLTNRSAADQDVADEVQHYLDEATAARVADGLSPEAAVRAARLEVGNVTSVREQVRGYGWESTVETLFHDFRYAARRLRAEPVFSAIMTLTLAVGIGATTAIFSVVQPVLFEPLPYPDAGRIVSIWEVDLDGSRNDGTFGMYHGLRERAHGFDAIAVFMPWRPALTGPDQPDRLEGQRVSVGYFQVLGVTPILGRTFQISEDRLNGANVVVLSDALWRRRFGADRSIIGRQLTLDDASYLVIGVMPSGFENVLAPAAELWAPLQYDLSQGRDWGHHLRMVGRLGPGVTVDEATRELARLGRAVLAEQRPATYGREVSLVAEPLHADVTSAVRPALLAMLGAGILVLLIACVNVTNLLLTRGIRRRGEFALRAALGAGNGRLIRQLLTESLLLAAMGGAVGMAVALLGVPALVALSPPGLPRVGAIGFNATVFAFGMVLTTVIGVAFGVIPALQAARGDPHRGLHHGSRRTHGGHRRTRSALVAAEVALALVLLVSSGLLFRSLERLFAVEAGFDSSHLLTLQLQTSGRPGPDGATEDRIFGLILEAVERVPGVTAAALTSQLPLSGDLDRYGVFFDPSLSADPGEVRGTFRYAVSAGYHHTMGIPLRRGRLLGEEDGAAAPRVALISESMAKRRLPGLDPIGRRVRIGDGPLYTIVGVVGDVKQMSLAVNESEAVYVTEAQWRFEDNEMSLVIRAHGEAAALAPAVRQAIWSVGKNVPIARVVTMDGLVAASAAERRFALILFGAFALAALVLAAAGLYGVLSGNVAERIGEIGVRSALGASRGNILALVVRQAMTVTGLGVAIGLGGAVAAIQVIASLLFGISRFDPVAYLGVVALLAGVAMVACGVPAWRAARVDPASALRVE